MDPLVMTCSSKTAHHHVNLHPNSTFFRGPYFSYRATWCLIRRDFVDGWETTMGDHHGAITFYKIQKWTFLGIVMTFIA